MNGKNEVYTIIGITAEPDYSSKSWYAVIRLRQDCTGKLALLRKHFPNLMEIRKFFVEFCKKNGVESVECISGTQIIFYYENYDRKSASKGTILTFLD